MLQSDTGPRVDERRWLKAGVEYFDGRMRLSTVITLDYSSWAMASLPQAACEISLLVSRAGDCAEVRYAVDGGARELAAVAYLPPDHEVLAGVMCAAPQGSGFEVTFHDLAVTPR